MEKLITETYYRFLTLADLALDHAIRPIADGAFDKVEQALDDKGPNEDHSGLFHKLGEALEEVVRAIHKVVTAPLNCLDQEIELTEAHLEKSLAKYGIDTNQWVFSNSNMEIFSRIIKLLNKTFASIKEIHFITVLRCLSAWTIIQKLYRKIKAIQSDKYKNNSQPQQDGAEPDDLKKIREILAYYSVVVNGTYSPNEAEYKGKTKSLRGELILADWIAEPYHPAYTISSDNDKKAIVLCIRGSLTWADFMTDLDSQYVQFSIVKNSATNQQYLRFYFDSKSQSTLKQLIGVGETTQVFNGSHSEHPPQGDETIVLSGLTHAGMIASAIETYKVVTPKLEAAFSSPEHADFDLVIAGHSLGGGVTVLLILLYSVHPLKGLKGETEKKMRGYTYAAAGVLSEHFDAMMQDKITAVIFGNDIVPRLSCGTMNDVCTVILALQKEKKEDPKVVDDIMGCNMGEEFEGIQDEHFDQAQKGLKLYQKIKANLKSKKLLPIGRTFHLEPAKQIVSQEKKPFDYTFCEVKDKSIFDELIFARKAVEQHFFTGYYDGLVSTKVDYITNN